MAGFQNRKFDNSNKFKSSFNRGSSFGQNSFNRGSSNRGGDNFKGGNSERPNFNNRDSEREMFETTCDDCEKRCEVPFKPNGRKPVYCSDCFENHQNDAPEERGGRDSFRNDRRDSDLRPRQEESSRPAFNNNRVEQNDKSTANYTDLKKQIDSLNYKMDKILNALEVNAPKAQVVEKMLDKSESKAKPLQKPSEKETVPEVKVSAVKSKPVKSKSIAVTSETKPKKVASKKSAGKKKF